MKKTDFQKGVLALAKAMEQGCAKTRKANGDFVRQAKSGAVYACAIGAAWVNGFKVEKRLNYMDSEMKKLHPVLNMRNGGFTTLFNEIIDRNDVYHHSRKQIIGWLRRLARLSTPPVRWDDVR